MDRNPFFFSEYRFLTDAGSCVVKLLVENVIALSADHKARFSFSAAPNAKSSFPPFEFSWFPPPSCGVSLDNHAVVAHRSAAPPKRFCPALGAHSLVLVSSSPVFRIDVPNVPDVIPVLAMEVSIFFKTDVAFCSVRDCFRLSTFHANVVVFVPVIAFSAFFVLLKPDFIHFVLHG